MMDDQEQRIDQVIREYDAQGWHRTGTETDRASAGWLAGRVRDCGVEAALAPFALSRIDPLDSFLEIEGRRIDGVPFFDGGLTDARGLEGRLGSLGSDAPIGIGENAPNAPDSTPFNLARHTGRHRALIAITRGHAPGLALTNAPAFLAPSGAPVLQVTSEVGAMLTELAARGTAARVVVRAERRDAESHNVVAVVAGRDRTLPPLVVSTPRSGWWHCAGERGGGIACWLEVLRAVAAAGSARDVLFVAMSGHELGPLGITMLLRQRPGLAERAHLWLHFGANIGAAQNAGLRFSTPDDAAASLVGEALARAGVSGAGAAGLGIVLGAESNVVARLGAPTIGVVGGNALFHLEVDRWPVAVDSAAIARIARGFADVAVAAAAAEPLPFSATVARSHNGNGFTPEGG